MIFDIASLFGIDDYAAVAGNTVSEGVKLIGRLSESQESED